MDLTTGLLSSGGQEDAGTDIYIQNRKIVSRSTEEDGGWGTEFLPNYQPGLGRTRFQIRLYTDGETDSLPWDTQKSNIDPYHPIMREAFNWVKRAGEKFTITYERFPGKFTEPYVDSNSHSLEREPYDYSRRKHVSHQKGHTPDEEVPQSTEVDDAVQAHISEYSVYAPSLVKEELRPGYEAQYDYHSDQISWEVPEEKVSELEEATLYGWLEEIDKVARNDASNAQRIEFGEEEPWWVPYYDQQLSQYSDAGSFESSREEPQIEEKVEERRSTDSLPEAILSELTRSTVEESDGEESTSGSSSGGAEDESGDKSTKSEGTENQDSKTEEEQDDEELEEEEGDDDEELEEEKKDQNGDSGDTTEESGQGRTESRSGTRKADEDTELIIIEAEEETYELLCDELDVSEDAPPEKVGNELLLEFIDLLQTADDTELESSE
ncbi:hypothetical protein [Halobacterium noricense]|uniref:hypothetical protein n=1 Tax=Halobacterium noricense TaxID=223182 RepID=UPI001E5E3207|nr:hypothetical protein [Halobacterium noricense]UHH25669.1 hypothetical protein LT974_01745 [Halobacterium noricense]